MVQKNRFWREMQMKMCPNCGYKNEDLRFNCNSCYEVLPLDTASESGDKNTERRIYKTSITAFIIASVSLLIVIIISLTLFKSFFSYTIEKEAMKLNGYYIGFNAYTIGKFLSIGAIYFPSIVLSIFALFMSRDSIVAIEAMQNIYFGRTIAYVGKAIGIFSLILTPLAYSFIIYLILR